MPNTRNNPPVAETLLVDTLNTFKDNMEKMFNSGIEKMNKSMELLHEEVSEIRMELKMVSDLRNLIEFTQAELKQIAKVSNRCSIANHFNTFFNNIGTEMAQTIKINDDDSFKSFLNTTVNTVFKFSPISNKTVRDIIINLNSKHSAGFDDISTILLKKLEPLLSE